MKFPTEKPQIRRDSEPLCRYGVRAGRMGSSPTTTTRSDGQLDRVHLMAATQAFEFDLARCAELDIGHPLDRVPNRIADEDLATPGLLRYLRRHRNVEPEEVVSASDRCAHVDTESHPDGPPVGAVVQGLFYLDTAEHGLFRIAAGEYER